MPRKTARVAHYKANKHARRSRLGKAFNALKANVKKNTMLLKNTVEGKQIYRDDESVALTLDSFSKFDVLDGLAQGVADTGTGSTTATGARIGNSINIKSITLNMFLDGATNVTVANPNGRVAGNYRVIIYNSPCGEALDETHILRNGSTTDQAIVSHYKIDIAQGKMYEIWSDRMFCLSDANPCKKLNFRKVWKNGKQVLYDNNNTTPSNFRPRVLVIGDSNANIDRFSYSFKVRYEDL